MRIGEYLKIDKKIKTARTNAGITQRNMAKNLGLTYSTYSNYENGYSEPPMEVILQFCEILDMSVSQLLELKIDIPQKTYVYTFSDLISIIIDLDRRGLPIKGSTSYINEKNQLIAHFSLDIVNAQLATFIPNWNKMNHGLNSGEISEEDYEIWLNDTLKIFNVPIDEYLNHK